jgi:hypothetical protein
VRPSLWLPGEGIMARWFVSPIVVPAGLALLLGAVMLYRQFIGV